MSEDAVLDAVLSELEHRVSGVGLSLAEVDRNTSLISQGALDSLSFLEFLTAIEDRFGIELDFSEMDPDEFSSVDRLVELIENEGQMAPAKGD